MKSVEIKVQRQHSGRRELQSVNKYVPHTFFRDSNLKSKDNFLKYHSESVHILHCVAALLPAQFWKQKHPSKELLWHDEFVILKSKLREEISFKFWRQRPLDICQERRKRLTVCLMFSDGNRMFWTSYFDRLLCVMNLK